MSKNLLRTKDKKIKKNKYEFFRLKHFFIIYIVVRPLREEVEKLVQFEEIRNL